MCGHGDMFGGNAIKVTEVAGVERKHLPCCDKQPLYFFLHVDPSMVVLFYQSEFRVCDTFLIKFRGGAFHGRVTGVYLLSK